MLENLRKVTKVKNTGLYVIPEGPNCFEKKKKPDDVNKADQAILDDRIRQNQDDEASHFLKNLIPKLKRLDP